MSASSRTEFIERAKRTRLPLKGYEPTLESDDLEPLAAIIGSARIVGLGESWHGAQQILGMRHRVIRFLVERMGFNAVIFEGSMPGSEPIDSFVLGGKGDAASNLRTFCQHMWLNPETVSLLDWLREHNAASATANKVRVLGMDVVSPAAAIFSVMSYLEQMDPDYAFPNREVVQKIGALLRDIPVGSRVPATAQTSTEAFDTLSGAEREQFRAAFVEAIARLEQNRANYASNSSHGEFAWMLRQATVVLQSYDVISTRSRDVDAAIKARDFAFAENISWILEQLGWDARVIIAAHNIHVSRDPIGSASGGPTIPSTGDYLARWFRHDYVAIGTAVGRGRISGKDPGLGAFPPSEDAAKSALAVSSLDAALEEVGLEHFLLSVPKDLEWAKTPQVMRSHTNPQPRYALANAFDALIYLDQIARSAPLTFSEK